MGVARLAVCVSGIYASFLLWAIAQERLSAPFPSLHPPPHHNKEQPYVGDKFPSPLFLNFAQALASSLSAFLYLTFKAWRDGTLSPKGLTGILGISGKAKLAEGNGLKLNGSAEKSEANGVIVAPKLPLRSTLPALLFQVSVFQTLAGPIGFLALRHISYPTMVLGKSCKLIPVLLLNVLLYRRRFSPHKYLVVALVTVGISLFMLMADASGKNKGGSNSTWGLGLLGFNLLIDGLTNSTQDQLFALHKSFSGQQMMFTMACTTLLLLAPLLCLPLPTHPLSILSHLPFPLSPNPTAAHLQFSPAALPASVKFLASHPTAVAPLLAYALLGGLGQLFIFETISHFGSLTLVMVTVTRKLFTMLLSVVLFEHKLTWGQWAGVAVVFLGIGVEAAQKRREMIRRTKRD